MKTCEQLTTVDPYRALPCEDRNHILKTFRRHEYKPGDLMMVESVRIDHVGLLVSGRADVCMEFQTPGQSTLFHLGPGNFFGDLACLTQRKSLVSIVCREASTAYLQSYEAFMCSLDNYPELKIYFLQATVNKLWLFFQTVYYGQDRLSIAEIARNRLSKPLKRAVQFIDTRFDQPLTVEQVAQVAGMSKSAFSRRFKQSLGVSFKTYLNQYRISKAKNLLSREDINVTEACFAVGFNDTAYFSRTFRRIEGQCPSQYKNRLRLTSLPPGGKSTKSQILGR